jgi:hypothetical protein
MCFSSIFLHSKSEKKLIIHSRLTHDLLLRTLYSSAHFAPQHTLLLSKLCSQEHFAPWNTLLPGTLYFPEHFALTDDIFESGAYGVPSKSQNPTILGQGGPSSTQSSNPSWACHWRHPFGTNNYPPF